MTSPLDGLLQRSAELERALLEVFMLPPANDTARVVASRIMCGVSFEHAESAKILTAATNFTSALGVVRLQYEALLRAFWLLFCASDAVSSKLLKEFSHESMGAGEKLPMQADMMTSLEGKAPASAMLALRSFQSHSWKPLSSYVHGGAHALQRHSNGYPVVLLEQVVKASNGLSTMAANLVLVIAGDEAQRGRMLNLQMQYSDCLPSLQS